MSLLLSLKIKKGKRKALKTLVCWFYADGLVYSYKIQILSGKVWSGFDNCFNTAYYFKHRNFNDKAILWLKS